MDKIRAIIQKISGHFFLRNLIIAISLVLVLLCLTTLSLNIFTRHGEKYEVPNLVGKNIQTAAPLIEDAELELVVIDSLFVAGMEPGAILDQSPEVGSPVKSGRKVFLVINAMNPRSEVIPYVTGYSLRLGKNILQSRGFKINKLIYKSDIATNNILAQQYKGRTMTAGNDISATLGEGVTLIVGRSSDAPLPIVPKVIGVSLREAQSRLWESGFNIGKTIYDNSVNDVNRNEAKVYKQTPGINTRHSFGATVTLYLSCESERIQQGSLRADNEIREAQAHPSEEITEEEFESLFSEDEEKEEKNTKEVEDFFL